MISALLKKWISTKKKRMNEQKKETQQLKKTMKNENLPNVNVLLPDEMR